jgi:hypothetical protein
MSRAAVEMIIVVRPTQIAAPNRCHLLRSWPGALRQEQSDVLAQSSIKDSRQNGKPLEGCRCIRGRHATPLLHRPYLATPDCRRNNHSLFLMAAQAGHTPQLCVSLALSYIDTPSLLIPISLVPDITFDERVW